MPLRCAWAPVRPGVWALVRFSDWRFISGCSRRSCRSWAGWSDQPSSSGSRRLIIGSRSGCLAFVGVRMIRSGLDADGELHATDPSRGATLIILSVATGIDVFAVGLSLAVLGVGIIFPSIIIGVVAGGMSLLGIFLGGRLGRKFGKRMEVIGGLILIAIGVRVVISHLL